MILFHTLHYYILILSFQIGTYIPKFLLKCLLWKAINYVLYNLLFFVESMSLLYFRFFTFFLYFILSNYKFRRQKLLSLYYFIFILISSFLNNLIYISPRCWRRSSPCFPIDDIANFFAEPTWNPFALIEFTLLNLISS